MKKILLITSLFCQFTSFSQETTNQLKGYYINNQVDDLYTELHFLGNGHALINNSYLSEYIQVNNQLYIFPDKGIFIFQIEDNKLKGINSWVENTEFVLKQTAEIENNVYVPNYTINPELLYQFYTLNYEIGTDQIKMSFLTDSEKYTEDIENLCNQGLNTACVVLFGTKFIEAQGGLNSLLSNNNPDFKANSELEHIAQQLIDSGDPRGYGLLGTYYLAIKDEVKGYEALTKGMELGDLKSSNLLMELELNQLESTSDY